VSGSLDMLHAVDDVFVDQSAVRRGHIGLTPGWCRDEDSAR
jgi:hypothetical protein